MHIYLDDITNINKKLKKYYFLNNYKFLSIQIMAIIKLHIFWTYGKNVSYNKALLLN